MDVAGLLIGARADVNKKNHDGQTPLMQVAYWASRNRSNAAIAYLLLKAGADGQAVDNKGNNVLSYVSKDNTNSALKTALASIPVTVS